MKNIYVNWLKKDILENCQIILKGNSKRNGICYKKIFNGAPWNESWTDEEAIKVMEDYISSGANIWVPLKNEEEVGFLVSTDIIPTDQQEFITYPKELIRFIEEIGILPEYRSKNIASELVRRDLINALQLGKEYLAYRTNIMRYFKKIPGESFETSAERIQEEDKKRRAAKEEIIVPTLSKEEKQDFVNRYVELIEKRRDLDVSNANQLFRKIFDDKVEFSKEGYNYTWQEDPTGENNDRIFPVIDLKKNGYIKTYYGKGGIR